MVEQGPNRIDSLYLVVSVTDNGDEGIMAFGTAAGVFMPMLCANEERLRACLRIARKLGHPFRVLSFTTRRDVTNWARTLQ